MPYYLYKISTIEAAALIKNLELLGQYDSFRDAKTEAKRLRAESSAGDPDIKLMFAENQLSAEEQLLEKREQPVLMEHER